MADIDSSFLHGQSVKFIAIEGTAFVIFGVWKKASGVIRVFMDDYPIAREDDLYAEEEICSSIFEESLLPNRTHTVVVNLHNVTSGPHDWKPPHPPQAGPLELHVTSIRYVSLCIPQLLGSSASRCLLNG